MGTTMTLAYTLSVLAMIALPLLLAAALRRRFPAPWWLFCLGMATFLLSQAIHLPLNNWLGDLGLLTEEMEGRALLQNAIILGLTAGLCEELVRAAGYGLLAWRRRDTGWADAVMLGLGHGGVEAMIVAVIVAATAATMAGLQGADLSLLAENPAQLEALERQPRLRQSPALALLPLVERQAISLHVTFSDRLAGVPAAQPGLRLLAILLHAAYGGLVYVVQQIESPWLVEGAVAVGAARLAVARRGGRAGRR